MAATVAPRDLDTLLGPGWRRPGASASALADALRGLVVDGRLAARTRVPSERALAPQLGVSRGTVSRAYDALRADGYLVSARGSGSWLALPGGAVGGSLPPPADVLGRHVTDLSTAALPAPEPLLATAAARAGEALRRQATTTGYAATGLAELRTAIAERFTARGLPTRADEILVTAGAQHGLQLLVAALCAPGDRALVDAPAYPRTLALLRRSRVRAVAVPLRPGGWDAAGWRHALAASGPRIAVTVPDFHNPTGLTATAAQRAAIAEACARAGTILVADETLSELRLDGPAPPLPLGAHDGVVTVGSMSKAAWGGLRLGWVRARPSLIRELAVARADFDMASPVLEQLVATELLAEWDAVLASRRTLLRERRDALLGALAEHAPAWDVRRPRGGMSAWVRLPTPVAARVAAEAARERLLVTPGPAFSVDGTFERHLRLPFTAPPDELLAAVRTLADLARRVDPATATAPDPAPIAV
jgi:DNA-binding transcriptional MocR family regulator